MIKPLALVTLLAGLTAANVSTSRAVDPGKPDVIVRREPGIHASVSKEKKGPAMTAFSAQEPAIFLNYQGEGLTKGDKIRTVWFIEDAGKGYEKNAKISEFSVDVTTASGAGEFHVPKPATGWLPGKYRVDVFVNQTKKMSEKFTVK